MQREMKAPPGSEPWLISAALCLLAGTQGSAEEEHKARCRPGKSFPPNTPSVSSSWLARGFLSQSLHPCLSVALWSQGGQRQCFLGKNVEQSCALCNLGSAELQTATSSHPPPPLCRVECGELSRIQPQGWWVSTSGCNTKHLENISQKETGMLQTRKGSKLPLQAQRLTRRHKLPQPRALSELPSSWGLQVGSIPGALLGQELELAASVAISLLHLTSSPLGLGSARDFAALQAAVLGTEGDSHLTRSSCFPLTHRFSHKAE